MSAADHIEIQVIYNGDANPICVEFFSVDQNGYRPPCWITHLLNGAEK